MASGRADVRFMCNGTVTKTCLHHLPPWSLEIAAPACFPTNVMGKSFIQWFAKRVAEGHVQDASAEMFEIHQIIGAINP